MRVKTLEKRRLTYLLFMLTFLTQIGFGGVEAYAQNARLRREGIKRDSIIVADSLKMQDMMELQLMESPIDTASLVVKSDSVQKEMPKPKTRFIPNANRALWLAMVFPGAGQIYNRKYWKLPIVYGGFVGCAYALTWNNKMYKDYSQAYLDIMDDDPNTKSFEDFLPMNANIADQEDHYKEIFRKRKDLYRRQRDLSIFCFIGVYVLSIIDAYVDAELSDFDISEDLSMSVEPAVFSDGQNKNFNSVGVQCSLKF